jgi:hypothetical protein
MNDRSAYTSEGVADLERGLDEVDEELQRLFTLMVQQAERAPNARAKEHLLNGAGRRLRVLQRALDNVFVAFPPTANGPIDGDDLLDAQVNLHAFLINLYGLFDNLAWAFVWRHGLDNVIRRQQVGLFSEGTTRYLPDELRSYVTSPTMARWFAEYLKNYRDALAHRIPPYIPPATYTDADAEKFAAIEREIFDCIGRRDWQRAETLGIEQHQLGAACPMFVHSFNEDETGKPLFLHPQMLSDAKTAIEACTIYLAHWDKRRDASVPV